MTAARVAALWFYVEVEGGYPYTVEPAASPFQAVASADAAFLAAGQPYRARSARPATSDEVAAWARRHDAIVADRSLPSPAAHAQHKRELIRTSIDGQNMPDLYVDDRPVWSRRPDPAATSAVAYTLHTLLNFGQVAGAAVAWIVGIFALAVWLLPYREGWILFLAVSGVFTLALVVLTVAWLDRLGPNPRGVDMKFCTICNRAVAGTHRHRRARDHADEYARRRILSEYRAEHGEWCPGTRYCEPGGHTTDANNPLEVDHLVPRSRRGNLDDGYRVICRKANASRGARPLEDEHSGGPGNYG